jgi:superfamily II DNA or RNA helicase
MEAFGAMAGLVTAPRAERREASVIVAAMQTLERRRQLAHGPVDLVVIDEAQPAVAAIWRRVLARFDGARRTCWGCKTKGHP